MDLVIIAALILVGIILLLIELFLAPGFCVFGLFSGGCFISASYYAFAHLGMSGGLLTLLVSAIVCVYSIVRFMRSKTLDRISLKTDITGTVDRTAERNVHVGDTGITTTRLALVGHADIAGHLVEVSSADGFLDEHTSVVVTRITDGVIYVRKSE